MTSRLQREGECHGCNKYQQVYCVNEPPLADDLLLCGECWMVRAFNDGLALANFRRHREANRPLGRLSGEVIDRARDLLKKTSGLPDTCPVWERLDDALRAYEQASDDYGP